MRLLIGSSEKFYFHFKEFGDSLSKLGVEYELVKDMDNYEGFNIKKLSVEKEKRIKYLRLIQDFKPDAVLIDRRSSFGTSVLKLKIPLFIFLRGNYWSEIDWAYETIYKNVSIRRRLVLWKSKQIAKKCFKSSKLILPNCKHLENIVKQHYPNKQTHVMHLGLDTSKWFAQEGIKLKHPCVGLVQTANIWGKTKEMLLLPKILEAMPDVMFYWVGDGQYRDKILPTLKKYENFKWLGKLEYPDKVRQFLTEIDVYALFSGLDMTPLSLLEAQLMEKSVVATNVGGIPEIMKNNETGYLVEEGNHLEWIEKLSDLLNDENKRKRFGTAGRNFVKENFSWEKSAKSFLSKYHEMF